VRLIWFPSYPPERTADDIVVDRQPALICFGNYATRYGIRDQLGEVEPQRRTSTGDGCYGGARANLANGFAILGIAGRYALLVPLAKTLIAGWLLARGTMPSDLADRVCKATEHEL
jgi:hypothetical protein